MPVTIARIIKANRKKNEGKKLTKEGDFIVNYLGNYYNIHKDPEVGIDNTYYNVEELNDKLNELKSEGLAESYKYKNLALAKRMLEKIDRPKNKFMGSWDNVLDINVAATMKLILIVLGLGLASIFTREYSSKVAYINFNIFGKPVLYPYMIIALGVISIIIMGIIYKIYAKK